MKKKLALALLLLCPSSAAAAPGDGCVSKECRDHVRIEIRKKWRKEVAPFRQWLDRTSHCESGSSGHYDLYTTGNGYFFAFQFNIAAWVGAGGRLHNGLPHGLWRKQPESIEQDLRAVRWLKKTSVHSWPICGV